MNTTQDEERAALTILKATDVPLMDAALLTAEILRLCRGNLNRARLCLQLGAEEWKRRQRTVTFRHAVRMALEERHNRRIRTLRDFRYYTRRLMKRNPGLASRRVRGLSTQDCRRCLQKAFPTPQLFRKGKAVLSAVFTTALQHAWCAANPAAAVAVPTVEETRVPVLSMQEIQQLLQAAEWYDNGSCAAAVGLMLYAGIRPHEVTKMAWSQVDLAHGSVALLPRHSKTGGARCIPIRQPLARILQRRAAVADTPICPPNWLKKWRELRCVAGWGADKPWVQDTLRHTFASYHLAYFRNYSLLQFEMGHRDAHLLRTRYVDLSGVDNPQCFWEE